MTKRTDRSGVLRALLAALLAVGLGLAGTAAGAQPLSHPESAPRLARIQAVLDAAHAELAGVREGRNADYIPELAKVDPDLFGIALVTPDGTVYTAGDADHAFSIQSVSKVFVLAHVMDRVGPDEILEKIGVNATGLPFNSVIAIELQEGSANNSLVNAGAMTTTGMVEGANATEEWKRILGTLEAFAGHPLQVDQAVYRSESAHNERNRAIAMLLDSYGNFYDDPATTVDLYTRQCSVAVTARDLAVMAGTFANGGMNPLTGRQVMKGEFVPNVLAVMATAGLYEDSGRWLYQVGLPAKSGVGGGMLAVAPGRFGIAAFSPPLDDAGNSVRAQRAIRRIAAALGANVFASSPR